MGWLKEKLEDLSLLGQGWKPEFKFSVWGRKIIDEVKIMEDQGKSENEIREYLENCADLRDRFLDPENLTDTEIYYTWRLHNTDPFWEDYGVEDPIWQNMSSEDIEKAERRWGEIGWADVNNDPEDYRDDYLEDEPY